MNCEGSGGVGCPKCGGRTYVTDSRYQPRGNRTRRRRQCRECPIRFTTYEMILDAAQQIRLLQRKGGTA